MLDALTDQLVKLLDRLQDLEDQLAGKCKCFRLLAQVGNNGVDDGVNRLAGQLVCV